MPMLDFPKIETYSRTFCGLIPITDKLLMLILNLEKVQISICKQKQFFKSLLKFFGSLDQVTKYFQFWRSNGPDLNTYKTTYSNKFSITSITINNLLVPLSEFLKAT